jgi:hypothetical protein
MTFPIRAALALALVSAMALPVRALPVMPFAGAADRDVVRDPYLSFAGSGSIVAVPFATGFTTFAPPVGGGFGGGGGGFGGGILPSPVVTSFSTSSVPLFIIPRPAPPVYFSLFNSQPQTNVVVGAVQVPDGGATVALLGVTLVALFLVRRSRAIVTFFRE